MYEIFFLLFKRSLFLIVIASFFPLTIRSQNQEKIDSINKIVESKMGIEKFDPLIDLVREYSVSDIKRAIEITTEAREVALKFGDSLRIVRSYRISGQLLNRNGSPKEAIEMLMLGMAIAKRTNNATELTMILNNVAIAYSILAEYDKALDIHFQTLVLKEEIGDKAEISITCNNIGFVYENQGDIERGMEYYFKSLKLREEVGDKRGIGESYNNIAYMYNAQNEKERKTNISQAVTSVAKHLGNTKTVCRTYYIHPTVITTYEKEILVPHFEKSYSQKNSQKERLTNEERALLSLLKNY